MAHNLYQANRKFWVDILSSFRSREPISLFLDWPLTSDEKWVFYQHVKHRRCWLGVRFDERPNHNQIGTFMIDAKINSQKLEGLNLTLKKKMACFSESKVMEEFEWEKIVAVPYYPDLDALEYHLCCSLQNHLDEVMLETTEGVGT